MPLDPELPPERLAFMLADSGADVLLTQEHLAVRLPPFAGRLVSLDADWPEIARESVERLGAKVGPEDVAYVIYTSGSTGKPKGVLNTHAGIVNRLLAMQDTYRLDASDRLLQKTQTSFDVSVREIFWPLIFGARLVVAAPGEHGNPAYLARGDRAGAGDDVAFRPFDALALPRRDRQHEMPQPPVASSPAARR